MSKILFSMSHAPTIHYCACGRVGVAKASGSWVCADCLKIEASHAYQKVMTGLAGGEFKGAAKVKAVDWDNYHGHYSEHLGVGDSLLVLEQRLRMVA